MKSQASGGVLFYSYDPSDQALCKQLAQALRPLCRKAHLSEWSVRQTLAGADIAKERKQALDNATLILLLLSATYLASDSCYQEMLEMLERQQQGKVRVIPVLLSPCDWLATPLRDLQCLPYDGRSVTEWNNKDVALRNVAQGIHQIIEQQTSSVYPTLRLSSVAQQNRLRLLKLVRQTWIKGVLEQPLHQAALIALDLQEQPNALANPWQLEVQETNRPARLLPAGTSIVQVYDHADGELLLLGEPGAGKTTLLLELTRTLLERAEGEGREPMPIVFNLSSWAVKRQPLENWLREELWTKYQVPYEVSQTWLHTDRVLTLLDGLDEVAKDARQHCVQAINTYHQHRLQEQGKAPLVVCCRSKEYMALPTRVTLQQAVTIQPLTGEQIENYLQSTHGQLDGLRVTLHQDPEFYTLAQQPLMLSIFTLAYQGVASKDIPTHGTRQALQRQAFGAYVERMLKHRSVPRYCMLRQLTFIAARMQQHQQTVLYLENLQPTWLIQRSRRLLYRLMIGLIAGLVAAFLYCLIYIPVYSSNDGGYTYSLRYGLSGGSFLGVSFGLFVGLVYGLGPIRPRETFTWAWRWTKQNVIIGGAVGLFVGLVIELSQGLRYSTGGGVSYQIPIFRSVYPTVPGLSSVLLASLLTGLVFGFHTDKLDNRVRLAPNQGIWRSAGNGLLFSLVIGLFVGLGSGLFYAIFKPGGYISVTEIVFGVITGLLAGLSFGLGAFLQHFTLRFLLWCSGNLSWSLVPLLDEASHRLLLRKVGGGYIFIHRLLLDYFASLETPFSQEAFTASTSPHNPDEEGYN